MKRIFALFLVCVLAVSLVACGDSDATIDKDRNNKEKDTSKKESTFVDDEDTEHKYEEALKLIEEKDYSSAKKLLEELGDDERAKEQLGCFYNMRVKVTSDDYNLQVTFNEKSLPVQEIISTSSNIIIEYTWSDDLCEVTRKCVEDASNDPEAYDFIDVVSTSTENYSYDANRNMIKEVYTNHYGYTTTSYYSYDANGNIIKKVYTDLEGDTEIYDYSYDANGNIIKKVYTDLEGDTETYDYNYDANGNMIKHVKTYSSGDTETYNYTYDANGNMIKGKSIFSTGPTTTWDYGYDANGNMIKEVTTYYDGDTATSDYIYDANGNEIKSVTTYSNGDTETTDYNYDANGNMIKQVYTRSDGYTITYNYSYDANGNMIKEVYTYFYSSGYTKTKTNEYKLVYIPTKLREVLFDEYDD